MWHVSFRSGDAGVLTKGEPLYGVYLLTVTVAVAPGSTMLNASASGRDADFPGSRGSGVSGT